MAEDKEPTPRAAGGGSSKEEVALELMRFIASTTGLGKSSGGTGFGGKVPKTAEDQVDVLLHLYERCRNVVSSPEPANSAEK